MTDTAQPIAARVAAREQWYHTLELAPGVLTPGWFDLRSVAGRVLPEVLTGLRCLDVGTFDGFWAFEMEKRGAAEVVAVDVLDPQRWDWPTGSTAAMIEAMDARKRGSSGFDLAAEALGSRVSYRESSVYELDPADHGTFDVVFMGSVLLHLRDPVRALDRLRAVCRPQGTVITVDAIDPTLTRLLPRVSLARFDGQGRPWWWLPSAAAYERMIRSAGLHPLARARTVRLPRGEGQPVPGFSRAAIAYPEGRRLLAAARLGDPQAVVHSRPAPA